MVPKNGYGLVPIRGATQILRRSRVDVAVCWKPRTAVAHVRGFNDKSAFHLLLHTERPPLRIGYFSLSGSWWEMLTTDPVVWPSEASNTEVCTLNSASDACGGENATRTFVPSEKVLTTPSILNSLLNRPDPSVENCEGALLNGAFRSRMSVPFTVPGANNVNSMAFPENNGNSRFAAHPQLGPVTPPQFV